ALSFSSSALWLLAAAALALGLIRWAYPPGDGPLTAPALRVLRALRAAGWLLVFVLLLGPVLRWPDALAGRFRVVWLTARSLSMDLPAAAGQGAPQRAARARLVRAALGRAVGGRIEIVERAFARTLSDSAGSAGPRFRGSTALGEALAGAG